FRNLSEIAERPIHQRSEFWLLARELLQELSRILYRKPIISQFVTNFLTRESRKDGHPAIASVSSIEEWMQGFLLKGQTLGAIRSDLSQEQLVHLAWGIWECCLAWLPREDSKAHVDSLLILNLFERAL